MNTTLYIEPYSGVAGDMFAAAMSELVEDHTPLTEGLDSLPIKDEFDISIEDTQKNGIAAKHFNVKLTDSSHDHSHGRTLDDIKKIINAANKVTPKAKETAISIFKNLAEAEAAVHGSSSNTVHFHEVGAVDAIVDVVSAAILLDILNPTEIISAPIALGQGTVKSAHGIIPVPSPATLELVKGIPVKRTTINTELTTPTGAAILKTITSKWDTAQSGTLLKSGYGAGTKDIEGITNSLRVSLLAQDQENSNDEEVIVIECNLDDYPAEHFTFLGPHLLESGALDFAIISATMKKGRQGIILQVLCPANKLNELFDLLLRETTTLGVRFRKEKRIMLERKTQTIETPLGKLDIKLAIDNDKVIKAKPEQSCIEKIAKHHNKSYFEIYKQLDYYTQEWLRAKS